MSDARKSAREECEHDHSDLGHVHRDAAPASPQVGDTHARVDKPSYKLSKDLLGIISSDDRTPAQREEDHELYGKLGDILSFGKSNAELIAEIVDLFRTKLRAALAESEGRVAKARELHEAATKALALLEPIEQAELRVFKARTFLRDALRLTAPGRETK